MHPRRADVHLFRHGRSDPARPGPCRRAPVRPLCQIGLLDLVIPFGVSYGRVAIGLGTISAQLIVVVLFSKWLRARLTPGQWRAFHRLSYVAFAAAFAHGIMSGTNLANPVVGALAWITAAAVGVVALRRVTRVRTPV